MSDTPDIAEAMRRARQEADNTLIFSYGTPIVDLQRMLLWHRVYEKELRAIMGWEQMP